MSTLYQTNYRYISCSKQKCLHCSFQSSFIPSVIHLFWLVGLWCLTPLSTIFLLYRGDNFKVLLVEETGVLVPGENQVLRLIMVVIVWQLDLQLPVQSVPITTKVVSSNPVQGEVYPIQHYVIKFVSDLRQAGGFLWFPPPIKLTATI